MKIVTIADTHGQHWRLVKRGKIPEGDIIIHAGDVSSHGKFENVEEFFKWYGDLNFDKKIVIAGNHDWAFENGQDSWKEIAEIYGITYLNDSGITYKGINIWGSPIQPEFLSWAFNRQRGSEIKKHWDLIPKNTDILITHGPAYKRLDKVIRHHHANPDIYVGCKDLENIIQQIRPVLHICGHIHEARGIEVDRLPGQSPITYVNAACLDELYGIWKDETFVFEWDDLVDGKIKNYKAHRENY